LIGSDFDHYDASRLKGEPAEGVDDVHTRPADPREIRVTLSGRF